MKLRFRPYLFAVVLASIVVPRASAQEAAAPSAPSAGEPAAAPSDSASSPSGPSDSADTAQRARELFRDGLTRFEAQDFRGAIDAFERAASLVPSADLWFNIARAHDELHEYSEAAEYYRRYLRDRVDPPDWERVEARIAALEEQAEAARLAARRAPTTGTLRVESNVDGADVTVDGRPLATTPIPIPLTLAAGRHDLELTHDGYVPFRAVVGIEPGVATAARVALQPRTGYRAVRGRRIWTWVLAGLGGAALGTSVGLGAHAVHLNNQGDRDRASQFSTYSDYALGSTMVLGVASAIVAFVEGRSVATERVSGQ